MTPETISITPEMIAILAIGVALAGLMLRGHHGLGRRMDGFDSQIVGLEQRFDKRIDGLEQRFDKHMDGFDERLRSLENGQSKLSGKLELVARYILARNLPAVEPALRSGAAAE